MATETSSPSRSAATRVAHAEGRLVHPDDYADHGYPHDAVDAAAPRGSGALVRAHRGPAVLGDHEARRTSSTIGKRPDVFLNGPRARDPPPARAADERVPADADPDRPAEARHLPPAHQQALHAALPAQMHGDIERIGKEIVDELHRRTATAASATSSTKVSAPLPIAVIAWMLGVPRERLEAALRLDEPHHRRGRSGVPGGGQDAAGDGDAAR